MSTRPKYVDIINCDRCEISMTWGSSKPIDINDGWGRYCGDCMLTIDVD